MSKSERKEKETEREIGERRTEEGEGRGEIRTASQSGNKILLSTRIHLYSHLHTRTLAIRQMFFFFLSGIDNTQEISSEAPDWQGDAL